MPWQKIKLQDPELKFARMSEYTLQDPEVPKFRVTVYLIFCNIGFPTGRGDQCLPVFLASKQGNFVPLYHVHK